MDLSDPNSPEPLRKTFKTLKTYGKNKPQQTFLVRDLFEEFMKEENEDDGIEDIFNASSSSDLANASIKQEPSFDASSDLFDESGYRKENAGSNETTIDERFVSMRNIRARAKVSNRKVRRTLMMSDADQSYLRPRDPNAGRVISSEQSIWHMQRNFLHDLDNTTDVSKLDFLYSDIGESDDKLVDKTIRDLTIANDDEGDADTSMEGDATVIDCEESLRQAVKMMTSVKAETPMTSKRRKTWNRTVVVQIDQNESASLLESSPSVSASLNLLSVRVLLTPLSPMLTGMAKLKTLRHHRELTDEERILMLCEQRSCITFKEFFRNNLLTLEQKIGEGVYGEVFLVSDKSSNAVLKIVPIEGDFEVNGEKQKSYKDMRWELAVTKELSNLRDGELCQTSGFVLLKCAAIVKDQYTDDLLKAWDQYDQKQKSENDDPTIFPKEQIFVVFLFEYAGQSFDSYQFDKVLHGVSACVQVAFALAVAEEVLDFEHRDLHWGNVLIQETDKEYIEYTLLGKTYRVRSFNVQACIIDYSYSYINKDGCQMFLDLADDETLFTNHTSIQGDVYRAMKKANRNDWGEFNPYTNVLWVHYLFKKLVTDSTFKQPKTLSRDILSKVQNLIKKIGKLKSCGSFVDEESPVKDLVLA